MLFMKPNCMCCDIDLPPEASAYICSFECTFCAPCAHKLPHCPGCGGELTPRPRRSQALLAKFPPTGERAPLYHNCDVGVDDG